MEIPEHKVKEFRQRLIQRRAQHKQVVTQTPIPPIYDAIYYQAVRTMDMQDTY